MLSWICSNVTFYSARSRSVTMQNALVSFKFHVSLYSLSGLNLDGVHLRGSRPTIHPESASSVLPQIAAQTHFSAISKSGCHFDCLASYPYRAVLARRCFGGV